MSKEYCISADDILVKDITIKAGSKKGDGFACDIAAVQFKAIFEGKEIKKNYIAKFAPDGPREEMLKQVLSAFEIHFQKSLDHSMALWSCGLIRHVFDELDREVVSSKPFVANSFG